MNPKVDAYFSEAGAWREELAELRGIVLGFPLLEELKWSKPCYSFEGSNVVLLMTMKESCALMFCKGALLKDAKGVLTKPGENTQAGRWIKFTDVRQIVKLRAVLKAYIKEAIEVEKAGLEVVYKKTSEYPMPDEVQKILSADPELKAAFEALTPGRQRGYLLFFSAPKQAKTRESRVEKCREKIFAGKGFIDR